MKKTTTKKKQNKNTENVDNTEIIEAERLRYRMNMHFVDRRESQQIPARLCGSFSRTRRSNPYSIYSTCWVHIRKTSLSLLANQKEKLSN